MGHPLGDYLHTNSIEVLPEIVLGGRDSRFRAGNILSCQRNTNTIFIVDRESGEVVWTWGAADLVGPHHPIMLANGNILVYDNGGQAGYPRRTRLYSRLVELDPVSGEIVWTYVHDAPGMFHHGFFSPSWGSAQRLPNGNTFSLDANLGRLFEVTRQGELVWEYVNGFLGQCPYGPRGEVMILRGVYRAVRLERDAVPSLPASPHPQVSGQATLVDHPPVR
jgi:outer membrane protein assembly factor BamB